jgi:aminoglycoside phosphotransferase (APT) family kinase protein
VPGFLAFARHRESVLLILEDLDAAGFPLRLSNVRRTQIDQCLRWLAEFHATFMGEAPTGLWDTGTYWHLATRPDELDVLDDSPMKAAAPEIDRKLNQARFQTFVHGDAKLANFCFSEAGDRGAALDFQYVGGGCGMKDVAYFIGSCLDEADCEAQEAALLDCYFTSLKRALNHRRPELDSGAVVAEWRALFPMAWADFHRFLKGWCPSHWKINSYSERIAREVIASL